MNPKIVEIPITELQNEKAKNDWGNFNENQCCLCGRKVGENPTFVHYLTNGNVTNIQEDVENSQGCFPVGSECAKKVEKAFRLKLENIGNI